MGTNLAQRPRTNKERERERESVAIAKQQHFTIIPVSPLLAIFALQ
jgi:hypothetical protein